MDLGVGKAGDHDLGISAQELVTGRTCVIAQSGAGKSWGIAVLCEHLCKSYIGFCLIDTEGEYFSLKDRFSIIWIGSDEDCDFDIETVDLYSVMRDAVISSRHVIFDVSEVDMRQKATPLVNILYELESELKKPFLLIVEEADKFIPQSRDSIKNDRGDITAWKETGSWPPCCHPAPLTCPEKRPEPVQQPDYRKIDY